MSSTREQYVTGLRDLADWLEANPDVGVSMSGDRLLYPLHSNAAVEAFAEQVGREVTVDEGGNASVAVVFGPIVYHAYGYADFDEHCARVDERQARSWAESHGLALMPKPDDEAA
ncbi:hypothetical protein AMK26_10520 [Streptomyces sp. CB03234]|uniref:hypothetical protein n=1 Tax=Streptomyces sp. (strain CB03234) TaxID=1703937 RepID=UPI000939ED8A|nr:hypothetical protein [Streptomyces sp. CB03234]OKK06442.1 hypothetical protein AMK26_10520 [Streptomyces sp. CB03234]